jgi:hypothetical protein
MKTPETLEDVVFLDVTCSFAYWNVIFRVFKVVIKLAVLTIYRLVV